MSVRRLLNPALHSQFSALALLLVAWTCASCGFSEAVTAPSEAAAMQAVREYGRGHQPSSKVFSNSSVSQIPPEALEGHRGYEARLTQMLETGDYGQLDAEAQKVRTGRDRVIGGGWKLNTFYAAVSAPSAGPNGEGGDWQAHIKKLSKWVAKDPQSAAARMALANAYMGWAWQARGGGYANTVSDDGWKLFEARVGMAKATLIEAARLQEKCPEWFFVMQNVSRAEGWSRSDEKELFDQAVSFEPSFYYFYQQHAGFLLPKWYGEEGETQAFINDVTAGIPEPDSSMLYFELSDSVACQCDPNRDTLEDISWPKVKEGYANIERLYGTVDSKNNRYAYMAYMSGDKAAAQQVFALIGDNPDRSIWHDQNTFDKAKGWAIAP
jgi:Domain of unknown function (DUF4034)